MLFKAYIFILRFIKDVKKYEEFFKNLWEGYKFLKKNQPNTSKTLVNM